MPSLNAPFARPGARQRADLATEEMMFRMFGLSPAGLALAALATFAGVSTSAGPANAVIYCKTVGVPQGCVVRPVVRAPIVYCKTRGVPKGGVVR